MHNTDDEARRQLAEAMLSIDKVYRQRGIVQQRFGFASDRQSW